MRSLAAVAIGLTAIAPAIAANATEPPTGNASAEAQQMNHTNLRQHLQSDLSGAGYSEIKIAPSSFYVQAKDRQGNPVAMVIGPGFYTEVTALGPGGSAAQAQAKFADQRRAALVAGRAMILQLTYRAGVARTLHPR